MTPKFSISHNAESKPTFSRYIVAWKFNKGSCEKLSNHNVAGRRFCNGCNRRRCAGATARKPSIGTRRRSSPRALPPPPPPRRSLASSSPLLRCHSQLYYYIATGKNIFPTVNKERRVLIRTFLLNQSIILMHRQKLSKWISVEGATLGNVLE